ncbi:MAG: CCA tRNA nucleotidyltransferase [Rickettsiales bacterium]|nr:CCA tRNA nucleotidyltransferase [Rickettsiales bacterium]
MLETGKLVLEIIESSGGEARFVGGCVRDFLKNEPIKDVDIATNLQPEIITKIFESRGFTIIPTGIRFGTITLLFNNFGYEITTLRKDLKCYGRHADVEFSSSFEEDSNRRDFTFNALYLDRKGNIYDFHNGRDDLEKGIVRFIGSPDERIKEDYLRILRLFRFQARYGKQPILENQLQACKENISGLANISGERIHEEMKKILTNPNSLNAIKEMRGCNVLKQITGLENNFFDFASLENYFKISKNNIDWIASLVALLSLEEVIKHLIKIKKIVTNFKLSNAEKAFFYRIWDSLKIDFSKEFEVKRLLRSSVLNEFKQFAYIAFAKKFIDENSLQKILHLAENFSPPVFPLNGLDLMNELKMKPSKELGELLRKFEELWEQENYQLTKDDMINIIRQN